MFLFILLIKNVKNTEKRNQMQFIGVKMQLTLSDFALIQVFLFNHQV